MKLSEVIEKFGRGVFEAPFAKASLWTEAPEIAEIRCALLDAVRSQQQLAGGRLVFPFDLVKVFIRPVGASDAAFYGSEFFQSYFLEEIRHHLQRENCLTPESLDLTVHIVTDATPADAPWLWIETEMRQGRTPSERARKKGKLTVLQGDATCSELSLDKARINIGRTEEVYGASGLIRRNQLAFVKDTPINRTVSREHAHICYHKAAGEYRIYNDRWYARDNQGENNCGLWILRDGVSQPVPRDRRGTRLMSGDEIHLGKAVLRFDLK